MDGLESPHRSELEEALRHPRRKASGFPTTPVSQLGKRNLIISKLRLPKLGGAK